MKKSTVELLNLWFHTEFLSVKYNIIKRKELVYNTKSEQFAFIERAFFQFISMTLVRATLLYSTFYLWISIRFWGLYTKSIQSGAKQSIILL